MQEKGKGKIQKKETLLSFSYTPPLSLKHPNNEKETSKEEMEKLHFLRLAYKISSVCF